MDKLPPDKNKIICSNKILRTNSVTECKFLFSVTDKFISKLINKVTRKVSKVDKKLHQYNSTEDCKFYIAKELY
jgi:hypothetical protein